MTSQSKKGLSLKILLPLGLIVFLFLSAFLARNLIKRELKYRRDQVYLSSVIKNKLPAKPLDEVKYPIKGYRIPGVGGFCWLEASSGLIKYLEPDVDFTTFVFYGQPTLFMAKRNEKERWGPGLNFIHAFVELGYTPFVGATDLTPPFPWESVMPDVERKNLIYFKTANEELKLIKKLVSAKIIPIVNYKGDFSTVVGYNQKGLWLIASIFGVDQVDNAHQGVNFMTPPLPYEARLVSYKDFLQYWSKSHQMIWFQKTGSRKPEEEIYQKNKKNAQEAPENIKKTIAYLQNGGNLVDYTYEIDVPSTISLYRYFQKEGSLSLANQYLKIARVYDAQRASVGQNGPASYRKFIIKTLTKVEPLYEKAAKMWP